MSTGEPHIESGFTEGQIRARVPTRLRHSFPFETRRGDVGTVELLIVSKLRWASRPESSDPAWASTTFGPFVVALRVRF